MNELEKCMAGEWYDCHDAVFLEYKNNARKLLSQYNSFSYDQKKEKTEVLKQLFGSMGTNVSVGQMPTYKLGEGKIKNYIAFSAKPKHFSMHSLDFEYVSALKGKLSNPGKGKGCVNISYDNAFDKDILITAIEEIIERQNSRLNI